MGAYLDRLAAADASCRVPSCAWASIPTRGAARRASATGPRRASSGSQRCSSRRPVPHAAAVKVNLAFFEAWGSAGLAALERLRGARPGGRAVHRRRQARRHRLDRRAARGGALRPPGRGRRDRQPVPRRGGHRAAARPARPVRLRAVPDVEPRRRRAPGAGRRGRPGARRARRSRSSRACRRLAAAGSATPGPSAWWSGPRRPRSWPTVREVAPGLPFLVPGVGSPGRRRRRRRCATGRPARRRPGRTPGGGLLVNVSRGIAGAAHGRRRTPARRLAEAAAAWARHDSRC